MVKKYAAVTLHRISVCLQLSTRYLGTCTGLSARTDSQNFCVAPLGFWQSNVLTRLVG